MRRTARSPLIFIACALMAAGAAAKSADPRDIATAAICDAAADRAAGRGGPPAPILRALTRTETGRPMGGDLRPWPWTVNMEGEGRWFATRAEAMAFVEARRRAGARSFDIGCFQINHRWHGHAFESVETMFDPDVNARYAAAFLTELAAEGGGWGAAAGRYHSRTPSLAGKYSARFARILSRLDPDAPAAPPAAVARAEADGLRSDAPPAAPPSVSPPRFERRLASLAAPVPGQGAPLASIGDASVAPRGSLAPRGGGGLLRAARPLFGG